MLLVERYLDRYPLYPYRDDIDRMVDDLYGEVGDEFPELRSVKGKGAHDAARAGIAGKPV
jgi:hypothetical protein